MTIFVVIRVQEPDKLRQAIVDQFPGDFNEVDTNTWLISSKETATAVSNKLKVTEGDSGSAMIFATTSYFGRAPSNIWDWIKTKSEQTDG